MTPKEVVQQYYDNLAQKNDTWSTLFAEDITFSDAGMAINEAGKDAVTQSFIKFLKSVEDLRVRQMIIENEDVCAIVRYDYINSHEDRFTQDVAEVWKVKEGKLSTLVIYFDITAFRNFMAR